MFAYNYRNERLWTNFPWVMRYPFLVSGVGLGKDAAILFHAPKRKKEIE